MRLGRRGRRPPGFTLLELLVVIAIIALLIGLLMPAVQKARESANRTSCANNLHQIAVAMHEYESDRGTLPPSYIPPAGASWAVLILPYMEQDNLFRRWDLGLSYYRQSDPARLSAVPNYFCPSRRTYQTAPGQSVSGDVPWDGSGTDNVPGALADYAVCVGVTDL
jgi:prepilin-type N-terminal cleavage/methylation domain-containing protein